MVYYTNKVEALLVRHIKAIDELENIIEIKIWQLPKPTKDKPTWI